MRAQKTVFDFQDYKSYLLYCESDESRAIKAFRAKLAKAIGCQAAYVSQILNGAGNFSLEQIILMNEFLTHDRKEAHFFTLLAQYARAGNKTLQNYFLEQMNEAEKERTVLQTRLQVKNVLSEEDKSIYYSHWSFAAVHVIVTIEKFRNATEIASRFNLEVIQIKKILHFLQSANLIKKDEDHFSIGQTRIHLGHDSNFIGLHHSNWRLKALEYARQEKPENLHYSSVITISEKDRPILRNMIINCIDEFKKIVRDSKEEDVFVFSADFFRL